MCTVEISQDRLAEQTLGQLLQQARRDRGAELAEVAAAIRVPPHYLRAIEREDYEALPGKAYAIGFIRCYAHYLGLPQQEMIDRYKAEANPAGPVHNVYWREPVHESRLPQRTIVFGGLIAAIGIYSIWFGLAGNDGALPAAPVVPDVVLARAASGPSAAPAADAAQTPVRQAPVAVAQAAMPTPAATPVAAPESAKVRADAVQKAEKAEKAEKAARDADLEKTVASLAPKVIEGRRPLALVAAESESGAQMVTVHVVEEAWLHVTQGDKILFSGVLPAGRDYRPPALDGVTLTTGNAGGVVLMLDDWVSAPLGKSGLVRRNVPLDAAAWRSKLAKAESF
ncbi:MAG: helix-turn-helix domain-containing protein [Alphaproteobacteria bacterium]|nr:MAG: helix-turn-helix domain-containing protein [Alphaproteobacteria bacterium]